MILNAHIHDMDLPDRRARSGAAPIAAGNPNGSLEEKCAWMRAEQLRKRGPRRSSFSPPAEARRRAEAKRQRELAARVRTTEGEYERLAVGQAQRGRHA